MYLLRTMAGACAVGALILGISSVAGAQTNATGAVKPPKAGPYRVRIGGFLPSNGKTRDQLGSSFLSYGIGYDIRRFETFLPGHIEVYADYFDRIKKSGDFGRVQANVGGIGLMARYDLAPQNPTFQPYAGVGIGAYYSRAKQETVVSPTDLRPISQTKSRVNIGGKVLLGTEISSGVFGEVEYSFVPHPSIFGERIALSGTQVRIGYHF